MNLPFGGSEHDSRAKQLTDAINRLLQELVVRCTKSHDEGVREYFDVGVFGYGSEAFGPVLGGELTGRPLVSIREIGEQPLRLDSVERKIPDGRGNFISAKVRVPVWFDLDALGKTPMCAAFHEAWKILEPWTQKNKQSLPPLIFNITDGEPTDGDPREAAQELRSLATDDGHAILFNVHISSLKGASIRYPGAQETLPDDFAKLLFDISSELPEPFKERFQAAGMKMEDGSRAFVFNADLDDVIQCLDIGTQLKMRH